RGFSMPQGAVSLCGLRREALIIAAQLVAGLALFGLNHWVSLARQGGDYTPFSVSPHVSALVCDETQLYAPGPRRFMQTGALPSEMDLVEFRDRVNGYPTLHAIVFGATGHLFNSLEAAWVMWHAVLPTMIWLLVYTMFRVFNESLLYCSAASWLMTLV